MQQSAEHDAVKLWMVAGITGMIGGAIATVLIILLFRLAIAPYVLSQGDKFDLLTNLLFILLGSAAAVGVIEYGILREALKRYLAAHFERRFRETQAEAWRATNIDLGLLSYHMARIATGEDQKRLKRLAEQYTRRAIRGKDPTVEWRDPRLLMAKNNLAYYLAMIQNQEKNRWDLKEEAEKLAEEVRSKYDKGDPHLNNPKWLETYAYVKARFAQTEEEKAKVVALIDRYLTIPELQQVKESLNESRQYLQPVNPVQPNVAHREGSESGSPLA